MLELHFKVNPRGKGRPRFFSRGKFVQVYTDAATRKYEAELAKQARLQLPDGFEPLEGPLAVEFTFRMPRPKSLPKKDKDGYHWKKPDLDNLEKCVDPLNGLVWKDDAQVAVIHATKRYDDNPGIDMKITQL